MDDVVIVSAARTPVGSFAGAFGAVPAHVLGTAAIQAAIARAGIEAGDVDEVILARSSLPAKARIRPARPPAPPVCRTPRPPSASTRSAAPACALWRSPRSRSAPARAPSSPPVGWRA